jgi:hypothetical protein
VADYGLAFRTADDVVGRALREGASGAAVDVLRQRLERGLADATGETRTIDAGALARALDPRAAVRAAEHGGGPSPGSVRAQLATIVATLDEARDRSRARRRAVASSVTRRRSAAGAVDHAAGRRADRDVSSSVCD